MYYCISALIFPCACFIIYFTFCIIAVLTACDCCMYVCYVLFNEYSIYAVYCIVLQGGQRGEDSDAVPAVGREAGSDWNHHAVRGTARLPRPIHGLQRRAARQTLSGHCGSLSLISVPYSMRSVGGVLTSFHGPSAYGRINH